MKNLVVKKITVPTLPQRNKISADNFDHFIEIFISRVQVSDSSKRLYIRSLRSFSAWLKASNILTINQQTLIDYKQYLDARNLSVATKQNYFVAVKAMFKQLAAIDELHISNFAEGIKLPKVGKTFKKKSLDVDNARKLIQSFEGDSFITKRNLTIVALMLFAGLRVNEVRMINREDIEFSDSKPTMIRILGKGHNEKDSRIRVSDHLNQILVDFIKHRGSLKPTAPLFVSTSNRSKGKRLSTVSISTIAKNALRSIGIDDRQYSAHSCRHSFATFAIMNGISIDEVSKAMRHASISTTMIYNHAINEENNPAFQSVDEMIFSTKQSTAAKTSKKSTPAKPATTPAKTITKKKSAVHSKKSTKAKTSKKSAVAQKKNLATLVNKFNLKLSAASDSFCNCY